MIDEEIREAQIRQELRAIVAEVLQIDDDALLETGVQPGNRAIGKMLRLRGTLLRDSESAYRYLRERFRPLGFTPLLRREGDRVAVMAYPGVFDLQRPRLAVALILLLLTVLSTIFVGSAAICDPINSCQIVSGNTPTGVPFGYNLFDGMAFSASLLAILLAHEFGHFIIARRFGINSSLPFFIPLPISLLGTMGAFITLKAPPPSRRALLALGISGPLAGMLVAIPVLLLGLWLSEVSGPPNYGVGLIQEGNSILYAVLKYAMFGRWLPGGGEDVFLHPVAMAGWAGLLVTGLNLIPAGQLDGGHILYALIGERWAGLATWALAVGCVVLGFTWPGWYLWALLITLFGQQRATPLDDVTPLSLPWRLLALSGLLLFILVFTPIPIIELPPA